MSDTRRLDQLHRLELGGTSGEALTSLYGLDLDVRFNRSNGSIFRADQGDRAWVPNYYQYWSLRLSPWLRWALPVRGTRRALSWTARSRRWRRRASWRADIRSPTG